MTRKEAIEIFEDELYFSMKPACKKVGEKFTIPTKVYCEALSMAIASLKTDEAYQLEYERTIKNDLAVDCIDRKATLDAIIKRLGIKNETYLLEVERVIYQQILAMPSVTPQLLSSLEKNSQKLEKNFGELDCIDRAELLKATDTWDKFGNDPNEGLIPLRTPALQDRYVSYVKYDDIVKCIKNMPSVTPQEPITWIVGKNNAQIAVKNMPIDKLQKICAIIGDEQESVLDKIRAEIEKEADTSNRLHGISEIGLRKALKIIDKYKAESEEKE